VAVMRKNQLEGCGHRRQRLREEVSRSISSPGRTSPSTSIQWPVELAAPVSVAGCMAGSWQGFHPRPWGSHPGRRLEGGGTAGRRGDKAALSRGDRVLAKGPAGAGGME
jgi:hypothetical protein